MPLYQQECTNKKCGHTFDDYRTMSKFDQNPRCPVCFGNTKRIVPTSVASMNHEYDKPVYSNSMGVHPDQVAERRRRFPGIPHTNDGRVIIRNQAELRKFSKELGFHDRNGYS